MRSTILISQVGASYLSLSAALGTSNSKSESHTGKPVLVLLVEKRSNTFDCKVVEEENLSSEKEE